MTSLTRTSVAGLWGRGRFLPALTLSGSPTDTTPGLNLPTEFFCRRANVRLLLLELFRRLTGPSLFGDVHGSSFNNLDANLIADHQAFLSHPCHVLVIGEATNVHEQIRSSIGRNPIYYRGQDTAITHASQAELFAI